MKYTNRIIFIIGILAAFSTQAMQYGRDYDSFGSLEELINHINAMEAETEASDTPSLLINDVDQKLKKSFEQGDMYDALDAIENGANLAVVQKTLNKQGYKNGGTLLQLSTIQANEAQVRSLLSLGADPLTPDNYGNNPGTIAQEAIKYNLFAIQEKEEEITTIKNTYSKFVKKKNKIAKTILQKGTRAQYEAYIRHTSNQINEAKNETIGRIQFLKGEISKKRGEIGKYNSILSIIKTVAAPGERIITAKIWSKPIALSIGMWAAYLFTMFINKKTYSKRLK